MNAIGMPQRVGTAAALRKRAGEARWSLGFLGLLLYLIVEYTRLPAMYPVLEPLRLGKVAVALAALGYLVATRVHVDRRSSRSIDVWMGMFLVFAFLSTILASVRTQLWGDFIDIANWVVIYFLLSRLLVSRWRLRVFMGLFILLNLKLAQFSVRGYIHERLAGLTNMEFILRGGGTAGSTGFFGNAADFGLAMCVVWGITWALLFRKGQKGLPRAVMAVCFVIFLLAILLCGSRGAVVGAAAVVLVAIGKTPKKAGAVLLVFVFLLGLMVVLPGASKERFESAWNWRQDATAYSRILFWEAGLEMWTHRPLLGMGPDRFPHVLEQSYTGYVLPGSGARAAHSLYIQAIADLGLVGTLTLLALVISFLRLNAKTRKLALASPSGGRRSFEYCLAAGLDLALVGYLIPGAFLSVLYYPHLWILLGLSVATHTVCLQEHGRQPEPAKRWKQKFPAATAY